MNHLKDSILRKDSPREFVENMLSDFFNKWKRDWEYAYSDGSIEDEIVNNDYEFLENGKPYLP